MSEENVIHFTSPAVASISIEATTVKIKTRSFVLSTNSAEAFTQMVNHAMDRRELPQDTWEKINDLFMTVWFKNLKPKVDMN